MVIKLRCPVYNQTQPHQDFYYTHLQDRAAFALLRFACRRWTRAKYRAVINVSSPYRYRWRTTHRIASSKTLFKFRCVSAEHSKYFWALISLATMTACSYCMGAIFFCLRLSLVASSSLRSSLVPTRIIGTPGAWWSISGYHLESLADGTGVLCALELYLCLDVVK